LRRGRLSRLRIVGSPGRIGFTPTEHARVIVEMVDYLDLDGFLLMVQDWGGPIGFDMATNRADRVRGIVHGQHVVLAG
jgi:haloalkane dehalogenase